MTVNLLSMQHRDYNSWDEVFKHLDGILTDKEAIKGMQHANRLERISEMETGYTIADCVESLKKVYGEERMAEIIHEWNEKNAHIIRIHGPPKYKCKRTGLIWDALDKNDNPEDYQKVTGDTNEDIIQDIR